MSQLSAEAEGKIYLNQAMMEGSRTGKSCRSRFDAFDSQRTVKNPDDKEESP